MLCEADGCVPNECKANCLLLGRYVPLQNMMPPRRSPLKAKRGEQADNSMLQIVGRQLQDVDMAASR